MNEIPFPQANDLGKILILIENIKYCNSTELKKRMILSQNRQLDYYKSASLFLGFLKKNRNSHELTTSGKKILRANDNYKITVFIVELLKTPLIKALVFNLKEEKISKLLNKFQSFKKLSPSTKNRRVSTIKSWIKWLNNNIKKG